MQTETTTDTASATDALPERELILRALERWIAQRPGLEYGNYGDPSSYRAECRHIARQLREARALLTAVRWRSGIGAPELKAALRDAYSGRLSWSPGPDGRYRLDYCTGQYWPTEYRAAVCAVLASALWRYVADNAMPAATDGPDGHRLYNGERAGDWLRGYFRGEFGRGIASRWFR